jgi:probable addiction module antidote protein
MNTRNKKKAGKKKPDYKKDLLNDLRSDKGYAAMYLSAALKDSPEAFLVALRDVAEASKGMGKLAKAAGVNRENLYRIFSEKGNPRLNTLIPVLEALDMSIVVEANKGPALHGSVSRK